MVLVGHWGKKEHEEWEKRLAGKKGLEGLMGFAPRAFLVTSH